MNAICRPGLSAQSAHASEHSIRPLLLVGTLCLARKMWYFSLQGEARLNATSH